MAAEFYRIHPETPSNRLVSKAAQILKNNGIAIYPTDSVYGLGCKLSNKKGIEKIAQFKRIKTKNVKFSFLFSDIGQIEEYTLPLSKQTFKIIKKNLPGPFTFILPASNKIPKLLESSRKTLGIRIPDNNIIRDIIRLVDEPILNIVTLYLGLKTKN